LSANSLSKEIQMSRTPILEAFKQLEHENLVRVAPRIGVIVNPLTMDNTRGKYVALSILEGYLAGEAARIGNSESKRKLQELNDEIKQLIDEDSDYGDLNVQFHEMIWYMADVSYIKQLILQMQMDYRRYSGLRNLIFTKFSKEYKNKSWQEHEDIIKSIIDGDVKNARSFMEHHIYRTREQFLLALLKEHIPKGMVDLDVNDIKFIF
jgi:DNA-binding GntR family transcriptional regulator